MQHRVDEAIKQTEVIEKDMEKWLRDVSNVVTDFEDLEKETTSGKQTCLYGWCPNLIWKYKLARRAEKKTNIMLKLRDTGKFDNVSYPTPLPGINVLPPKEFMPFESTKYTFNLIFEALKDDRTNVVGLYGTGGVGKTTLAKAVVNKAKEDKIFNKVVMVVVTQNPNIIGIQDHIADFLDLKLHEKSTEGRAERLYMRLKNEKKILIILDDIWEKLDLKIIGIPVDDHHKNCKIFLTTRRKQVCIDMRCQSPISLGVLNEEGFVLFKRHVGFIDDSPTMINLAKEVAKECKGLPLAIVAIGSALKGKGIDEWMTVTQNLKKSKLMDVDIVDANVHACLQLSYDYLKNEKTKLCFLLCALFPEDHEIDMEDLVRYGMGLGLYQDTDTIVEARTELRILLLDANEGYVKMHDVVRDVALWITSKGEDLFMVKAGMGLTEWPKHEGLEQCKAISLLKNDIEVFPDSLLTKLEILDLRGSKFVELLEVIRELSKLRMLDIRDYFGLKWIPVNVIQRLSGLEELYIGINVQCRFAQEIARQHVPSTAFSKLVDLNLYSIGLREICWPQELRNGLRNLEELRIHNCGVQVIFQLEGLEQELSLPSLKVLELMNLNELECLWKGPTHLLSLQNLKMLRVIGCNRLRHMFSPTLPRNLLHLEVLIIKYCGELEQIIVGDHTVDHVQLGLFPNLYSISVTKCDKLKALFPVSIARSGDREIVMPRLENLMLHKLACLVNFCPSGYHFIFPYLSRLVVNECPKITTRFSVDQNRSVHAEAEAPQTSKEDVDMEESPPEVTREIYGWFSNDIQNSLPPYIGK
ncbi:hypothetical protein ACOSQ2_020885 [Xanthoceras sorbifolium]